MSADPFLDEDSHVLTSEAFEFVLNNELKRAVRSQNYLTLVHVEPTIRGGAGDPDSAVREIARLISRDVRETDLLARTVSGRLSIVLLDADFPNSIGVIDRLMSRLNNYAFSRPLTIKVGAACCPTHGADVESLRREAEAHSVHPRPDDGGEASNAH